MDVISMMCEGSELQHAEAVVLELSNNMQRICSFEDSLRDTSGYHKNSSQPFQVSSSLLAALHAVFARACGMCIPHFCLGILRFQGSLVSFECSAGRLQCCTARDKFCHAKRAASVSSWAPAVMVGIVMHDACCCMVGIVMHVACCCMAGIVMHVACCCMVGIMMHDAARSEL
jgi:hypothetical protein